MIQIKPYSGKKDFLIKFLEDLQDHVILIDPLKRFVRLPEYGIKYAEELLEKVKQQKGQIFFAEFDGTPVGVIIGRIDEVPDRELLECIPSKMGTIEQLFVEERFRGRNIGSLLINRIEKYFINQQCDVIYVGTLAPNLQAHNFYKNRGYSNRIIELMKTIP